MASKLRPLHPNEEIQLISRYSLCFFSWINALNVHFPVRKEVCWSSVQHHILSDWTGCKLRVEAGRNGRTVRLYGRVTRATGLSCRVNEVGLLLLFLCWMQKNRRKPLGEQKKHGPRNYLDILPVMFWKNFHRTMFSLLLGGFLCMKYMFLCSHRPSRLILLPPIFIP